MIDNIIIFCAGRGNRMKHLSKNSPKSLIQILQKPILYYSLELCKIYPFKKIVINTHYLADQIKEAVKSFKENNPNFTEIEIIYEDELLETGGAIKNVQHLLGSKPIFAMNSDTIIKSEKNIFNELVERWQPNKMEFLLLMHPTQEAIAYNGHGDFEINNEGKISRPDIKDKYSHIFSGLQIIDPTRIYKNPLKIFSLREYYFNSKNVYGQEIKGTKWYHASTPEDIVEIEIDMLAHEKI